MALLLRKGSAYRHGHIYTFSSVLNVFSLRYSSLRKLKLSIAMVVYFLTFAALFFQVGSEAHLPFLTQFCLCPHDSIDNSCMVNSIHSGCIPVIMSNYYDLPFNDILDWRKFSVKETDVYLLKDILKSITEKHFMALNRNLLKVQKHFKWNTPPVRLDVFHMVMFEFWLHRHLIRLEYEPAFMWYKDTCGPIGSNRIANSIHYSRAQVNFDFWKLAVTWPEGYCKYKQCHSSLPHKFIIHGLWPSTYIGPQPSECTDDAFTSQMVKQLYPRLKSDWPSLTMKDKRFWSHEWREHGTCSTMEGEDYFELALDIYSWNDLGAILLDAGISPGASYDFYDVTNAIKARIGVEPELTCLSDDLVEIRLCLNRATPPEYIYCSGWTNCPYFVHFE